MTPEAFFHRLSEASKDEDNFPYELHELAKELPTNDESVIFVSAIFRFMESYPNLDYGSPGALVKYAEKFLKRGYEKYLTESISRHPTSHTLWMLNRLINGAEDEQSRTQLMDLMRQAVAHPLADPTARERAEDFLNYQLGESS